MCFLQTRQESFHNTVIGETGITGFHKSITYFFRSNFERIPPEKVDHEMVQVRLYKSNNDMCSKFLKVFKPV